MPARSDHSAKLKNFCDKRNKFFRAIRLDVIVFIFLSYD